MTQKFYDLDRWQKLNAGQMLSFDLSRPRTVTIEVNAPQEALVHVSDSDGVVLFVARVLGRDRLEFGVRGPFSLSTDVDDVFIYTDDSARVHHVNEAPESFTKVMTRRHRNPELEAMMRLMKSNMDRQLAKQAEHYEQLVQRSVATIAAQSPAAGAAASAAAQQRPSPGDGHQDAPPAGGGSES